VNPLSVYLHIPFCTIKCGYCDFNTYAGMHGLMPSYRDALTKEVAAWGDILGEREVVTIGFGGGTPGEMPTDQIGDVIAAVRDTAGGLAAGAEVTLEANPGTTSFAHFEGLRRAGVTRLSLGAQSFDPAELRFLDRIHSPEATEASLRLARKTGFESVSLDLMYGLPGQSMATWERNLAQAIALAPDHLSAYALTVEEGTPLAFRVARGAVEPLEGDDVAAMYDRASDLLDAAGYRQYELSNWATPGHESRHNLAYWTDRDYLGLGAGAHGYLDGERYENVAHPRTYIAALDEESAGTVQVAGAVRKAVANQYVPDRVTAMFDWLTLALRRTAGFEPAAFAAKFGVGLDDAVGPVLDHWERAGLLERDGHLRLSKAGRQLHSEFAVHVLGHLRERAAVSA
jgi:oxygen-independent coproporphyrinogen-3 oxidase